MTPSSAAANDIASTGTASIFDISKRPVPSAETPDSFGIVRFEAMTNLPALTVTVPDIVILELSLIV